MQLPPIYLNKANGPLQVSQKDRILRLQTVRGAALSDDMEIALDLAQGGLFTCSSGEETRRSDT